MVQGDFVPRRIELQIDPGALLKAGPVDDLVDRARVLVVAAATMGDLYLALADGAMNAGVGKFPTARKSPSAVLA